MVDQIFGNKKFIFIKRCLSLLHLLQNRHMMLNLVHIKLLNLIRSWLMSVMLMILEMDIYGDDYDLGSQTIMVQLNENDQVWVRHVLDLGFGYVSNEADRHCTTFMGALIVAL